MSTSSARTKQAAEIRAVIEKRLDALRAKDAARVVAHGAPELVFFALAPPLVSTEMESGGLEAWFSTWDGPIGFEMRGLTIVADEDVAFSHGLVHLTGSRVGGERTDVWFRQTLCFRKIKGAWKIAHEHESVPFYMDGSYKAAIDLKP